jgi:hypothetical protein
MFHPIGPKRFRSITVEWKKHNPNKIHFTFAPFSSLYYLGKYMKVLFRFALNSAGGSLGYLKNNKYIMKNHKINTYR